MFNLFKPKQPTVSHNVGYQLAIASLNSTIGNLKLHLSRSYKQSFIDAQLAHLKEVAQSLPEVYNSATPINHEYSIVWKNKTPILQYNGV